MSLFRKVLMVLSFTIILSVSGNGFSILKVHAEAVNQLEKQKSLIQVDNPGIQTNRLKTDQEISSLQGELSGLQNQMKRVTQAIQDNNKAILNAEIKFAATQSEVDKLENEIKILKDSIEKRNNALKERALSYQQSERHITYLEVLLGSTSFSDFVNRVGAVTTIMEADRNLLEQQETEKKEYENKKVSLEKKLTGFAMMKTDLEGMRTQLTKQQKEYELLTEKLEKEDLDKTYIDAPTVTPKEHINTIITAGYKYIGNSVYVFGGGRTAYDIANGRFDCSGFVHWAFAQAGIEVGTNTDSIKNSGRQVSTKEMEPGDLVFFDTYKKDGHVGIYIGNGKFIGSQSSTGVRIVDMTVGYWKDKFNGRVIRI